MAATATFLRVDDLPPRQISALRRKARRMGLTAQGYVRQLIEDDLALDRKAQTTPMSELAAPFRKAMKGLGDAEIDRIVDRTRRPVQRSGHKP